MRLDRARDCAERPSPTPSAWPGPARPPRSRRCSAGPGPRSCRPSWPRRMLGSVSERRDDRGLARGDHPAAAGQLPGTGGGRGRAGRRVRQHDAQPGRGQRAGRGRPDRGVRRRPTGPAARTRVAAAATPAPTRCASDGFRRARCWVGSRTTALSGSWSAAAGPPTARAGDRHRGRGPTLPPGPPAHRARIDLPARARPATSCCFLPTLAAKECLAVVRRAARTFPTLAGLRAARSVSG